MEAILLLEYAAPDASARQAVRERLAALAMLDAARVIFAAAEDEGSGVLALGFSDAARAEAALNRWSAEGALPPGTTARLLVAEPAGSAQASILLFP